MRARFERSEPAACSCAACRRARSVDRHALIGEALYRGLDATVRRYLEAIAHGLSARGARCCARGDSNAQHKKTPPKAASKTVGSACCVSCGQPCFWTKPILIMLAFFAAARTLARTP
jgi:hypothetical protein